MFGKTLSRLLGQNHTETELENNTPVVGGIAKMLSTSGRVSLATLQTLAEQYDIAVFEKYVLKPVLVGSAIKSGSLSNATIGSDTLNSTKIFRLSESQNASLPDADSLKHAIYPLVKGEYAPTPRGIFHIGRINDDNDIIMPDYAISKRHATIEIVEHRYYISDAGSTNGTKLNGQTIGRRRTVLHDKDVMGFARYEFTLLYPQSLHRMLHDHSNCPSLPQAGERGHND